MGKRTTFAIITFHWYCIVASCRYANNNCSKQKQNAAPRRWETSWRPPVRRSTDPSLLIFYRTRLLSVVAFLFSAELHILAAAVAAAAAGGFPVSYSFFLYIFKGLKAKEMWHKCVHVCMQGRQEKIRTRGKTTVPGPHHPK